VYYYDYYEKAIEGAVDQSTKSRAAMSGLGLTLSVPVYDAAGNITGSRPMPGYSDGWFTPERVQGFLEPLTQAAQLYTTIRAEPYRQQLELANARRALEQARAEALAKQQAADGGGVSNWTWAYAAVAGVLIVGGAYMLSKRK
jgi:hypothetical protein